MDDHAHHHHHHAESDQLNVTTTTVLPNVTMMVVNALANASSLILNATAAPAMHHADDHHDHHMTTTAHVHGSTEHDHDGMDHDKMGHGDSMGHGMDMTFHTGVTEKILFKQWEVTTVGGMIGSVIGIFLIALLYEGLKFMREYLYREHYNAINYSSVSVMGHDGKNVTELHKVTKNRVFGWPHLLQTSLHVTQVLVSYFLMLIFMTYNVWLCLAVLLGSGLGYFFFGWKKATIVDISEHCH